MTSSPTFAAILPGRTEFIPLCHDQPGECRRCLGEIARVLAQELGYDARAAVDKTTESYQAEPGTTREGQYVLTLEQARELRRVTVLVCYAVRGEAWPAAVLLADNDAHPAVVPVVRVDTMRATAGRLGMYALLQLGLLGLLLISLLKL